MIDYYKKVVFENYANFKGRARRSEYWWYTLGSIILFLTATILDRVLEINFGETYYGPFYLILALATFIPGLAVAVRRLHDVGKSGWFYFIILIPFVGAIWLLILFCIDGEKHSNEYGTDPKGYSEEIDTIGRSD